jgi:hypothetical protein
MIGSIFFNIYVFENVFISKSITFYIISFFIGFFLFFYLKRNIFNNDIKFQIFFTNVNNKTLQNIIQHNNIIFDLFFNLQFNQ